MFGKKKNKEVKEVKVYCRNCRHLCSYSNTIESECKAPGNLGPEEDSWYDRRSKPIKTPQDLNANNDCELFGLIGCGGWKG